MRFLNIGILTAAVTLTALAEPAHAQRGGRGYGRGSSVGVYRPYGGYQSGYYGNSVYGPGYGYGYGPGYYRPRYVYGPGYAYGPGYGYGPGYYRPRHYRYY